MAFVHSDFLRLANPPGSTRAEQAYQQIKNAVVGNSAFADITFDTYLQGSYLNSTNVKEDSDIDVVLELTSSFCGRTSHLSALEQSWYQIAYPSSATYTWELFKKDVGIVLKRQFGDANVDIGNKAIKVKGNAGRLNADVVPTITYKNFNSFTMLNKEDFVSGIAFWTSDGTMMTNYPKIHKENGIRKNHQNRTYGKYKDFVRIFKRIRGELADLSLIQMEDVPSYSVECLIYNVPDNLFVGDYKSTFLYITDFILRHPNLSTFFTVSHQHHLFGTMQHQWKPEKARNFIRLADAWYKVKNGS
ncbi:MAG TPA: nucleotidyltransferase [Candidatus Saccharimonadales bacterium]|nr:nucleotidyltransferase [Candidatus Saccharimonadales bacterium]